ncbi:copper amine oxidase N-terminal domain-containing protein [Thermanaerosceptrum fracticalcis]|nr:copper amine oxidase N-terminal domain-containing protein [Thermanaerosceptrum fracticalcis]
MFLTVCAQGETGNAHVILSYPLNGEIMEGNGITVTGAAYDSDNDQGVKNVAVAIKAPDGKYLQSTGGFNIHPAYFPTTTSDGFNSWKSQISLSSWLSQGVVYTIVVIVNDGKSTELTDPSWTFISSHTDSKGVNINSDVELCEANLDEAVLGLELINMAFADSIQPDDFVLHSNISGLVIKNVIRENNSKASLVLDYEGSDFDEDTEISVTVKSSALKNWNSLTSNTLNIRASKESLTVSAGEQLIENLLNGAVLNIQLKDVTFRDQEINAGNFLLVNAPEGLSVAEVVYQSSTTAAVNLAFTNSDFDTDINDFSLTIKAEALSQGSDLNSNLLYIKAVNERSDKLITGFTVPGQVGQSVIDSEAYTVTFRVPYGTTVTSLIPSILISEGATVSPGSGVPQDFSQPATYLVTAEDLSTQNWVVMCIVESPPGENNENDSQQNNDNHNENNDNNEDDYGHDNTSHDEITSESKRKKNDEAILRETVRSTGKAFFSLTGRPEGKVTFLLDFINELEKNNVPLIIENNGITVEFPPGVLKTSLWEQALQQGHSNVAIKIGELTDNDKRGAVVRALTAEGSNIAAIGCKMVELSIETFGGSGNASYSRQVTGFNEPVSVTFDMSSINLGILHIVELSGVRIDNEVTLNPVPLGGIYDRNNKTFTFYTDKFSILTVGQAKNLVTMSLMVGNTFSKVNGILRETDIPMLLFNNRVMVPLRFIGEALGAEIQWEENTGTIIVRQGKNEVKLVLNQPIPGFDIAATVIKGRTLVPIRYIAESFGAQIMWFPQTKTVYLVR